MWPDFGVVGPWRKTVPRCEGFGGVENGKCGCDHGKNNERTGKVDTTKEDLC